MHLCHLLYKIQIHPVSKTLTLEMELLPVTTEILYQYYNRLRAFVVNKSVI